MNAKHTKNPEDREARIRLLRKKAEEGDLLAEFAVGWMLWHGEGMPEDRAAALSWYRKAAEAGHAEAALRAGDAYLFGDGADKDEKEAGRWYRVLRRRLEAGCECSRFPLRYSTGEEILPGDRVRIAGDDGGVVRAVFGPGTEEGAAWACPGG